MIEYRGEVVETGGTSIKSGVAPAIRKLVKEGRILPGMKVLEWGAGKFARNADYLRKLGCKVYAYDPYNANGTDGWNLGKVSSRKPRRGTKFDVAFSCFVLNVVRVQDEKEIIQALDKYAQVVFHITRNKDIYDCAFATIKGGKRNKWIKDWWDGPYFDAVLDAAENEKAAEHDEVTEFCQFGFCTGPGKFQRIPSKAKMGEYGYGVLVEYHGYTIFQKNKKLA